MILKMYIPYYLWLNSGLLFRPLVFAPATNLSLGARLNKSNPSSSNMNVENLGSYVESVNSTFFYTLNNYTVDEPVPTGTILPTLDVYSYFDAQTDGYLHAPMQWADNKWQLAGTSIGLENTSVNTYNADFPKWKSTLKELTLPASESHYTLGRKAFSLDLSGFGDPDMDGLFMQYALQGEAVVNPQPYFVSGGIAPKFIAADVPGKPSELHFPATMQSAELRLEFDINDNFVIKEPIRVVVGKEKFNLDSRLYKLTPELVNGQNVSKLTLLEKPVASKCSKPDCSGEVTVKKYHLEGSTWIDTGNAEVIGRYYRVENWCNGALLSREYYQAK